MGTKLVLVAVTGLVVCAGALTGAFALSAGEFPIIDGDSFGLFSPRRCAFDEKAMAGTRKLAWNGGDSVTINVPATIRYRRGSGEQLEMRGDPQMLAHIEIDGDKIHINCSPRGFHREKLEITLPGRTFHRFQLNGAGDIRLEDLDQGELEISMAGASKLRASGKAGNVHLSLVGASDAQMEDLAVERIDISIVGAGSADIAPRDEANVSIVGAGSVRLATEPKTLHTNIIGAGDIKHAGR